MTRTKSKIGALGVVVALGISVFTAAPAMAAEASVGGYSCPVSVMLTANSTQETYMRLNAGGKSVTAARPGNSSASDKVLYSRFGATTSGGASTGGTIYWLGNGCDY